MLKATGPRQGRWTGMPPRLRREAKRKKCSVCRIAYGFVRFDQRGMGIKKVIRAKEHIHHLIPRRYLEDRHRDPHFPLNLISICAECHGKMKLAEDRLFSGDLFGWLSEMRRIQMPLNRIYEVARKLTLVEFFATGTDWPYSVKPKICKKHPARVVYDERECPACLAEREALS